MALISKLSDLFGKWVSSETFFLIQYTKQNVWGLFGWLLGFFTYNGIHWH